MEDYGHFSADGTEYMITTHRTPGPWVNYISTADYGLVISHTGSGYSVHRPPDGSRITAVARDETAGRYVFVLDHDTGRFWSITWNPVQEDPDTYQCRHGLGYTVITSESHGIEGSLRLFVPLEGPVEIWSIRIRNLADKPRRLSIFTHIRWWLAGFISPIYEPAWFSHTVFDPDEGAIIATLDDPACPARHYQGFFRSGEPADGYDCRASNFSGPDGKLGAPAAVAEGRCTGSLADGDEGVGVFEKRLELEPGEERTLHFLLGFSSDRKEREELCSRFLAPERIEDEFARLRAHWQKLLGRLTVSTPDEEFDRFVNVWLKYQVAQCMRWVRGHQHGYRDVLQDAVGLLCMDSELSRTQILRALRYQYAAGNTVRQWSETDAPHDLRKFADGPAWIIFALCEYIKETGDTAFLDQEVPYLDGGGGAVLDHAQRALSYLWNDRGDHGLSRIHEGDWNDALSEMGIRGRGESVWLSEALVRGLRDMAALCAHLGRTTEAEKYAAQGDELKEAINTWAWDGEYYLRGYDDAARPVGSHKCREGRIFLNPQSWAIISEVAQGQRAEQCLAAVRQYLSSDLGPLVLSPPYTSYDPSVGRLSILRPGLFENGAVFCHAAMFLMVAYLMQADPDHAYEVLKEVLPSNPKNPLSQSTAQPYVLPNGYTGPANAERAGKTSYGWLTGTASWALVGTTAYMLGVRPEYAGLAIRPRIPSAWKECRVRREFRGAIYEITISRKDSLAAGEILLTVDGQPWPNTPVPAFGDGRTHRIEVLVGP